MEIGAPNINLNLCIPEQFSKYRHQLPISLVVRHRLLDIQTCHSIPSSPHVPQRLNFCLLSSCCISIFFRFPPRYACWLLFRDYVQMLPTPLLDWKDSISTGKSAKSSSEAHLPFLSFRLRECYDERKMGEERW